VRRPLAVVIFGLIMLLSAPAAHASEYPPQPAGSGVLQRAPAPAAPSAAIGAQGQEDSLARTDSGLVRTGTGRNVAYELAVGVGLLVLGSVILAVARRRRAAGG
jgi:hypothetical protein